MKNEKPLPVIIEIGIKGNQYIVMNIYGNTDVGPSHIMWTVKEAKEIRTKLTELINLLDKN